MNFSRMRAKVSSLSHLTQWKSKEQRETWSFIKRILFYPPWFLLLLVVCYNKVNQGAYQYKSSLENLFTANLSTIHRVDQLWSWLQGQFLNTISSSSGLTDGFLSDYSSYIVSTGAQLRQVRVVSSNCKYDRVVNRSLCYSDYNYNDNEERGNFSLNWIPTSSLVPSDLDQMAFFYTLSSSSSHTYTTTYRTYPNGGGYVFPIRPLEYNSSQLLDYFQRLEANNWIDEKTRAVFIQLTLYNVNINMFAHCILLFELTPLGTLIASQRIIPAALYTFKSSQPVMVVLDVLYLILTTCLGVYHIFLAFETNCVKCGQVITWLIVITSWISFGLFMGLMSEQTDLINKLNGHHHYQVVDFLRYEDLETSLMLSMGLCCFLATLKLIQLASFNYHVEKMLRVYRHSARQLAAFTLIYIILLGIFINVAYLFTNTESVVTSLSYSSSLMACVLATTGHIRHATTHFHYSHPSLIIFVLFICWCVLAMKFLFVSILSSSLREIRQQDKSVARRRIKEWHEWIDMLVDMFLILKSSPKDWLDRLRGVKKPRVPPRRRRDRKMYNTQLDSLEKRSDWLVNQVNNMSAYQKK